MAKVQLQALKQTADRPDDQRRLLAGDIMAATFGHNKGVALVAGGELTLQGLPLLIDRDVERACRQERSIVMDHHQGYIKVRHCGAELFPAFLKAGQFIEYGPQGRKLKAEQSGDRIQAG